MSAATTKPGERSPQIALADCPDFMRLHHVARLLGYGVTDFTEQDLIDLGIPYVKRKRVQGGIRVSKLAIVEWMKGGARLGLD